MMAGGPYKMTVAGTNTLTFDDVLVGEVWVCSGQSNMEFTVGLASAQIEDGTVVVSSDKVAEPAAVRYGWADNPVCNLYNSEGLPASPFRTDGW